MNTYRSKKMPTHLFCILIALAILMSLSTRAHAFSGDAAISPSPDAAPNNQPAVVLVYDASAAMRASVVYSHEVQSAAVAGPGPRPALVYDATAAMETAIIYPHEVQYSSIPVTGRKPAFFYDATGAMQAAIIYPYQMNGSARHSLEVSANDFSDAFVEKDVDRLATYFSDDVVAMYPLDAVPTVGQMGNFSVWQQAFQVFESHPLTTDSVTMSNSNDVGYSTGRWAASGVPEMGNVAGRYIATWVKTKAGWRITHLSAHIHSDVPPGDILNR